MVFHMGTTAYSWMLCVILMYTWIPQYAHSANNVGCLFSSDVCEGGEECFDDNVFGRCQLQNEIDYYRHTLSPENMKLLERELTRLLSGGYSWGDDYTQCVVQNILYTNRHEITYDPGLCSRVMQFTLPEVSPELLSELESPEPKELAFIKFQPNREGPNSDVYADEIFTPPIFEEGTAEDDKPSRRKSKTDRFDESSFSRNFSPSELLAKHPDEKPSLTDKETLLNEVLKAAEDTQKLFDVFPGSAERFPEENTPVIRTQLSSDLNQYPGFSEGGTQWMPVDDDRRFDVDEIIEPYDKKRVKVLSSFSNTNDISEENNLQPQLKNTQRKPEITIQKPTAVMGGKVANEEAPTFGRSSSSSEDDDRSFHWNSNHRSRLQDDNLLQFAKGNPRKTSQRGEPDTADNSNLSDVIENDYLEDNLYAILPGSKGFPTFSSDKRYDIKKPGPTYMIHEDEDGETSMEDDDMAQDPFIQGLIKTSKLGHMRTLFTPPEGISKSSSPFLRRFEATDEISRIYVTAGKIGDEAKGEKEVLSDDVLPEPPKLKTYERFSADQPEMIEGVDLGTSVPLRDEDRTANAAKTGEGHIGRYDSVDSTTTNLAIKEKEPSEDDALRLVRLLEKYLNLETGIFSNIKVNGKDITFKVNPNSKDYNASTVAAKAEELSPDLKDKTGLTIEEAGIGDKVKYEAVKPDHDRRLVILTFALCGGVAGILLAAIIAYLVSRHSRARDKLQNVTHPDTQASQDYQDLCRQRMASKANEKPEPVHTTHSPKKIRSLSQEGQASSSSHSSASSWNEEPVMSNMDISTGHMILSYMEDHLKNKDRLDREWEALCAYEAELCSTTAATQPLNIKKNRYTDVLPYDHSRVVLNELTNVSGSDFINASSITDHDPRNPAYIATQGPLPQTAADFWQMIWEQGSVVTVMLSRLMENGAAMCHRYWPEEGSEVYHIYEVHLVSEHIWCDDYLVRSFYLKNLRTSETRTVTQFHFMSWPDNGVPNSAKALLEFRRKVNKSYRGRSCPIVVHCSDGIGRTGTYCLIDMVLNRMAKGAKEIDIAATLEHVRDQRAGMVKTKAQFEFVLMAIAEEVHAILKALSQ